MLPLVSGHAQISHVDNQVSRLAMNQYICTTYLYVLSGQVYVNEVLLQGDCVTGRENNNNNINNPAELGVTWWRSIGSG